MGLNKGNKGIKRGIITEELLHRIDSLNDEMDNVGNPYKSKRKETLNESELFEDSLYTDSDESNISSSVVGIIITILLIVVVIGVAALIVLK